MNAAEAAAQAEAATSVLKKDGAATEAAEVEIEEVVVVTGAVAEDLKEEAAEVQATNHVKVVKDAAAEALKGVAVEAPVLNPVKVALKDAVAEVPIINRKKEVVEALKEKAAAITSQEKEAAAQIINHVKEKAAVLLKEKLVAEATIEAMLLRSGALKINHIPHRQDLQDLIGKKEEKLSLEVVMHPRAIAK